MPIININMYAKDGKASHLEKGSASELRAHTYHNYKSVSLCLRWFVTLFIIVICRNVEITRSASSASSSITPCSRCFSSEIQPIRLEHTAVCVVF